MGRAWRRVVAMVGGAAATLAVAGAGAAAPKPLTYEVTITNLARNDLTPPVYAVHDSRTRIWAPGRRASRGLATLAEDGGTSRLVGEIRGRRGVARVGTAPRMAPRGRSRFTIRTTTRHRRLSFASMLTCSNDGFAGLSSFALPLKVRGRSRFTIRRNVPAWDAGSERNTESRAHVPCLGAHGVGPSESRRVARHPGIRGIGDLVNSRQGWDRNAARIEIRRVG